MPEGEHRRPFTEAFNAWFASAVDLHDIMQFEPFEDRDAMEISFLIGRGALLGYGHPTGISIAVMLDDECWDFLFDEEVVPENDEAAWHCSLCATSDRRLFPSVEALWMDHLFDPLRRWIDKQLRPATALEFHQVEGATWARLMMLSEASKTATSVIFL